MPTVEIDGRRVEVEDGLTVIQAAERLGIEIPHYCWHPGLSIAGNCRMCLVEIEKQPKLQIACNTRVVDGMVVHTQSERTKAAQRAVLEFLLVNHPIDCPVCDQAGECKLQEYYMDYDRQRSRVALADKVRKRKAVPIGPLVMLDQERCILCARCTRFLDEVTKTHELAIFERGNHCEVALAPGKTLDNPYAGNVIDICPVGALTSRDFRFRARVWYLEETPSVCGACANGCNIQVFHREGRIYRFQPRYNPAVNQYWMCDPGRLSCHELQGESRLLEVLRRTDDHFVVADWPAALDAAAAALREAPAEAVRIVASAKAPNEELYLLRRLGARLGAAVGGVAWSPPDARGDDFLLKADKNPNTQGLRALGLSPEGALEREVAALESGRVRVLVLHRTDLVAWGDAARVRRALEAVPYVVVLDTHGSETAEYASVVLPIAAYTEIDGTFTNHAGRVQRLHRAVAPPGAARPGWQVLAELLGRFEEGLELPSAARVFAAIASEAAAFAGLDYARLGAHGVPLGAADQVAAGSR
ncbi:MAG TPA: molybdopterin-dependent oxidoreductase [Candidatus Limnocylindria bacterium]|nr:molybdopterin-dependent oxidoreductase [Candidatus Limnocylindria bacterium]